MSVKASRRSVARAPASSWASLIGASLVIGCASLLPEPPPQPALFALEDRPPTLPDRTVQSLPDAGAPTLLVSAPRAGAGYDSAQMVYVRRANQLESFALNRWVDTPARMLEPLIARAVERTGAFRAVLRAPTAAAIDLRLDTEIVRMQQDFTVSPSQARFTLRAVLIETATRRVVASQEFDAGIASTSDDPYGGVAATNAAVQRLLGEVAAFCVEVARNRR